MNDGGKSDGPIVPKKPANKGGVARLDEGHPASSSAEQAEGRGPAKGNSFRADADRTRCRASLQAALNRIRQAANREKLQRRSASSRPGCVSLSGRRRFKMSSSTVMRDPSSAAWRSSSRREIGQFE